MKSYRYTFTFVTDEQTARAFAELIFDKAFTSLEIKKEDLEVRREAPERSEPAALEPRRPRKNGITGAQLLQQILDAASGRRVSRRLAEETFIREGFSLKSFSPALSVATKNDPRIKRSPTEFWREG